MYSKTRAFWTLRGDLGLRDTVDGLNDPPASGQRTYPRVIDAVQTRLAEGEDSPTATESVGDSSTLERPVAAAAPRLSGVPGRHPACLSEYRVKGRSPNLSVVIWRSAPRDDVDCHVDWSLILGCLSGGHSTRFSHPIDEGRAVTTPGGNFFGCCAFSHRIESEERPSRSATVVRQN